MINWIVTSSILILIVTVLRFVLRGKISLRLQYALWLIVLIRLLVPFEFGAAEFSLLNQVEQIPVVQEMEAVQGMDELYYLEDGSVSGWNVWTETGGTIAEHKTEAEFHRMERTLTFMDIFKPVRRWGTLIFLFLFFGLNTRFDVTLQESRKKLETEGKLPVYLSDAVETPCLFGLFTPEIYVTPEAASDETVLRHTIEHETTHYLQKDHIWSFLRGLALCFHWFNPLVWLAVKLSKEDGELACDEATIQRLGEEERYAYGKTLIEMTKPGRNVLLGTATTMTGSKSALKERIERIAKKPKMAAYTLAAVVVIAAAAVVFTFTGAQERYASFGEWTESLTADDIQWAEAANGYGIEEISYTVPENEFDDLTVLLSTILDEHCIRKDPEADDNGYRLALYRDDKLWLFKCLEDGSIGLMFNDPETGADYGCEGKLLIIDCPALWDYIKETVDSKGILDTALPIDTSDLDSGRLSEDLIDYAKDYVQSQIDYYTAQGIAIVSAEITNMQVINTGAAALNCGVDMYRLEYRLLPAEPKSAMEIAGVKMDGDEITELGNNGQPHILKFYYNPENGLSKTKFTVLDTATIESKYGTPSILEEFGNAYTAAAMEFLNLGYYEMNETENRTLIAEIMRADADGDGNKEIITVYEDTSGMVYTLQISEEDGTVIWEEEAGTPHLGWNTLMWYSHGGKEALVRYNPYVSTGLASDKMTVFRVKEGAEEILYEDEVLFEAGRPENYPPELETFLVNANELMAHCTVLLSTEGGETVIGPASPQKLQNANLELLETMREMQGTPSHVTEAMKNVDALDFTYFESLGGIDAFMLADALHRAADNEITLQQARAKGYNPDQFPFWYGTAYRQGYPDTGLTRDHLRFELNCHLPENIVEVTYGRYGSMTTGYYVDEELYKLLRYSGQPRIGEINQASYAEFEDILTGQMESYFDMMSASQPAIYDYELIEFHPVWEYEQNDGDIIKLYDFDYGMLVNDPESIQFAGGMIFDGYLRLRNFNGGGQLAVMYRDGRMAKYAFMENDFYFNPERLSDYPEDEAWAKQRIESALDAIE